MYRVVEITPRGEATVWTCNTVEEAQAECKRRNAQYVDNIYIRFRYYEVMNFTSGADEKETNDDRRRN